MGVEPSSVDEKPRIFARRKEDIVRLPSRAVEVPAGVGTGHRPLQQVGKKNPLNRAALCKQVLAGAW